MTEQRVKTGIKGLDEILGGGFLPAASVLLEGPPGSGKTNLGLQILYNGIAQDGESGILVSFEQSPEQIYRDALGLGMDLRPLREQGKLEVILTSPMKLQEVVAGAGSEMQEELEDAFARIQPRRVLIDSVSHFRRVMNDEVQLRELLMDLLHRLVRLGATTFLTKEIQTNDNAPIAFEEYLVDASLRLYNLPSVGLGSTRRLIEVRKTRGHEHLSGRHPMLLTSQGVQVFPHRRPQVVAVPDEPVGPEEARVSTGVRGLDYLLHGGLVPASSTLFTGTAGAGKTTFANHFIKAGLQADEPCLLIALNESPRRVATALAGIGIEVERARKDEQLVIHYVSPIALCPEHLYLEIEQYVGQYGIKRVVIDSVSDFTPSVRDPNLVRDYLYTFVKLFESRGVTAVMTSEMEHVTGTLAMSDINFAFVVDAVIYLGFCEIESHMRRVIMVLKQRGSSHETELRELVLAPDGPKIGAKFTGLSGVSGGVATGQYQATVDEMIQPLKFIRGFAEQLQAGQVPPEKQQKLLDKMVEQADRMMEYLCDYYGIDRPDVQRKG